MNNTENTVINKMANASIITFDLEDLYPKGERITYDLKENLFQGLILREKDFRSFIKSHNFGQYQDKYVHIICSADAIVPTWAYMVLAAHLEPFTAKVIVGSREELETAIFKDIFEKINWNDYQDQKVVVKGCSKYDIPHSVYAEATRRLAPIAKLVMFGEACSSVPVYKKPKQKPLN